MGRALSVQGGNVAPFPLSATVKSTTPANIPVEPTVVDLGSVTLPGGNIDKRIEVTVTLVSGGDDRVTLHFYRNGVEVAAADVYAESIVTDDDRTVSAHWVDADVPAGQVTYSVRAGSIAGLTIAGSRRVTATTAS